MKFKILHVLDSVRLPDDPDEGAASGMVRACLELARAQTALGHSVTVISVTDRATDRLWDRVRMHTLAEWRMAKIAVGHRTMDLSQYAPLVLYAYRNRFDVVHAHGSGYVRFIKARARVIHLHTDPILANLSVRDVARLARDAQGIVVVNHRIRNVLGRYGVSLPPVTVVHNGASHVLRRAVPGDSPGPRPLGIPADAFVFLFLGAIVPEKGVMELVEAFRLLSRTGHRAYLVVAGGASLWGNQEPTRSEYEDACLQRLRDPMIYDRVRMLGVVGHRHVMKLYAAVDAVVVPSQCPEAAPLVVLEGLANGLPVVASNLGGIPEYLGDAGLAVSPDPHSLARAMEAVATDPGLRARLRERAFRRASLYSWERSAKRSIALYETIFQARDRSADVSAGPGQNRRGSNPFPPKVPERSGPERPPCSWSPLGPAARDAWPTENP